MANNMNSMSTWFESPGKKNVAVETKTNPVVRTKLMDAASVRVNSGNGVNIVNLELTMASGRQIITNGELDESKRAPMLGVIAFDIDKMTSKNDKYPGSTENGTPVMIHKQVDGVNTNVYFDLDLTAMAHRGYDDKMKTRYGEDVKIDTRDTNRDRIDVTQTRTTTHNGVAGIAMDGVMKNVAETASAAYLLSAGANTRENPNVGAYSKDVVEKISKAFVDKYNSFIKTAIEKGCPNGVQAKNPDGTLKKDGKNPVMIEGTAFPPLKDFGVKVVTSKDKSMTVLAMNEPYNAANAKTINFGGKDLNLGKALAAMNAAFNAEWKQEVNGTYTKDAVAKDTEAKAARTLGNMIGLNSYTVSAYDGDTRLDTLGLIQPSMTAKMQPFASALNKSINVATHNFQMTIDGKLVEDATPTQAYGEGVIEKANEIMSYGGSGGSGTGRSREQAQEIQTQQLNEIYNSINGTDLPSVAEAAKEAEASINK